MPAITAYSDCEACGPGLLTQPVNTLSSLAYVVAGAAVLAEAHGRPDGTRPRPRPGTAYLAWGLMGVGVGSVAYHGPGGVAGRWAHDASLVALSGLLTLSCWSERRRPGRPVRGPAAAGVSAVAFAAANPATSAAAQLLGGGVTAGAEASRHPTDEAPDPEAAARSRRRRGLAAGLLVAGIAFQLTGRTGGPLCRPDSVLQPHAAWHMLSAAALWLIVRPAPAATCRPAPSS